MTKELLGRFETGVSRLIDELESTRVRLKQAEAEADGLRIHGADRDRLETRVRELEAERDDLSRRIGKKDTRIAEVEDEMDRVRGRLAELEEENRRLATETNGAGTEGAEAGKLRAENEDLRKRLDDATARDNQNRQRLGALVKRIEETEALLDSVEIAQHGNA